MKRLWAIGLLALAACSGTEDTNHPDFSIPPEQIKSGYEYITAESQALQNDDFANPGYLWAEKGAELFEAGEKSCKSCHSDPDADFATPLSYPAFDTTSGELVNLEGRINLCRTRHQQKDAYIYESEDLLALTTYIKSRARGRTINYTVTPELKPHYENGKEYFYKRRGQLNLSCHQCHDQNNGRKMRGDTVSQGHINGFPAYRNDWQTLGSSHRRFEACDIGVRAEPYALGSQSYIDLEIYLMARGSGLKTETPAIRR